MLVTSAAAKDGKSTVSWNLSLTAASVGSRTMLLECDFHQPSVATRHGLRHVPGIADLLAGESDQVVQQVSVSNGSNGEARGRQLDVVVAGTSPPNSLELMESEEMAALIDDLAAEYDLVVLDAPPITMVSDVIPLSRLVSGVIVVAEPGRIERESALALRKQLESLDAPVLGVVAKKVKTRAGYGYSYYHDSMAALRTSDHS